jgi:hypothetical protein
MCLFARGRQIAAWDQQIWAHIVGQWIAPNIEAQDMLDEFPMIAHDNRTIIHTLGAVARLPLWVKTGPTTAPPGTSVAEGRPDEIRAKADIAAQRRPCK